MGSLYEPDGGRERFARTAGRCGSAPEIQVTIAVVHTSHGIAMRLESVTRAEVFGEIWRLAHAAAGRKEPSLDGVDPGPPVPRLSEPWYCCSQPTEQQLQSL